MFLVAFDVLKRYFYCCTTLRGAYDFAIVRDLDHTFAEWKANELNNALKGKP